MDSSSSSSSSDNSSSDGGDDEEGQGGGEVEYEETEEPCALPGHEFLQRAMEARAGPDARSYLDVAPGVIDIHGAGNAPDSIYAHVMRPVRDMHAQLTAEQRSVMTSQRFDEGLRHPYNRLATSRGERPLPAWTPEQIGKDTVITNPTPAIAMGEAFRGLNTVVHLLFDEVCKFRVVRAVTPKGKMVVSRRRVVDRGVVKLLTDTTQSLLRIKSAMDGKPV